MQQYLKQFATHSAYNAVKDNLDKPNVVLCTQEDEVHFNKLPEASVLLTLTLSEPSKERISINSATAPGLTLSDCLSNVKVLKIDNNPIDIDQDLTVENAFDNYGIYIDCYYYNFESSGVHTVEYILKSTTVEEGMCSLVGKSTLTGMISLDSKITGYTATLNNVTRLYAGFAMSGLVSINIPNSVTAIEAEAFHNCSYLSSINIPNSITTLENGVFWDCINLNNVVIGNGVTSIGSLTFAGCNNLTSITIPNNVLEIKSEAFDSCNRLTNVIIGSGVTSIGMNAFNDCINLEYITSLAINAPTIFNNTFISIREGGVLTVPQNGVGYESWMSNSDYYLGSYNWTLVRQ